jgi:hypothetical protein
MLSAIHDRVDGDAIAHNVAAAGRVYERYILKALGIERLAPDACRRAM